MINRLKRKFLLIGTLFMLLLMAALVTIMNAVNYGEVVRESDAVLDTLVKPSIFFYDEFAPELIVELPIGMSPEVPYESRFFVVMVSGEGEILQADLSRIISVDKASAADYINKALASGKSRGFAGQFRYDKQESDAGVRLVFLDCGRKLDQFKSFLLTSVLVGLGGCAAVFAAFMFAAGRIVAPIAESYEKQKRFISDAGHEIKTPLTIINANVDIMEADGEKEELTEIRRQTKRLTELTNDLVTLSKMEEAEHTMQRIDFPLSDIFTETAASMRAPAAARGLELNVDAEPGLTANGSPEAIRRLISVLLENAVKYAKEGAAVTASLAKRRRSAVIKVHNACDTPIDEAELPHIFDRFYRTDLSRNSATGGHGIGLSIARAVAEAHGGSIEAASEDGGLTVTAVIPLYGKL